MKTAVEEIREALQASRSWFSSAFSSAFANVQITGALGRLDELEKQIAEAEERGRDEAFGVLHSLREALPTISGGIRHHAFKAREAFREVERALCHYDTRAAERAKGGGT